jgi:hypothetical protein
VIDRPQAALAVERERLHVACPTVQISARASARPAYGLSAGAEPSGAIRIVLPRWLSRRCAYGRIRASERSPVVDVEHPVGAEREARAVVHRAVEGRQHAEDHADLVEAPAVGRQHAARDAGPVAAVARLGVAPEDRPVRCERRAERDIEQPALSARVDRGQAADRLADLAGGETMRRRPGFSVTRKSPPGSGSSAHG